MRTQRMESEAGVRTSETINELATALTAAQAAMRGAVKDADNPYFKSKYADLASVWEACRKPLTDRGLSVVQSVGADGVKVRITTLLAHTSGQWIADDLVLSAKEDSPQAIGSCITYGRRYALAAFVGVAPEDDDGEAAEGRAGGEPQKVRTRTGVVGVEIKPTTNKHVKRYEVRLTDGRTATTIKDDIGSKAQHFAAVNAEVDVVIERGKYGPELIEMTQVAAGADTPL